MASNNDKKGGSRKVVCTGKLPYSTPEVERELADPTHRQKTFAKPLFELATTTKRINQYSWSKADAERMKANNGYYVKLHRPGGPMELPFDEFVTNAQCVVEHCFNNHKFCGKWCLLSPASLKKEETTEEKQIELCCKYRNKDTAKEQGLYTQIKDLMARFLTTDMLDMCYHPYDSQKNESMNIKVNEYAPQELDVLLNDVLDITGCHGQMQ